MINTLNGLIYDKQEVDNEVEQLSTKIAADINTVNEQLAAKIDTDINAVNEQLSVKIDNDTTALSLKVNDCIEQTTTQVDNLKERINDIVVTGTGGVSQILFEDTVSRLDTEDTEINTCLAMLGALTPTYIIDSQEKFDAFCAATKASDTYGNDYRHVYIKNGTYNITDSICLDNDAVPVLSITGESKQNTIITLQTQYAFYCTKEASQSIDELQLPHLNNLSFTAADLNAKYTLIEKANSGNFIINNCKLTVTDLLYSYKIQSSDITYIVAPMTKNDITDSCFINSHIVQDTTITIDGTNYLYQIGTSTYMLSGGSYRDKTTVPSRIENVQLSIDKMHAASSTTGPGPYYNAYDIFCAISAFTACINCTCTLNDEDFMLYVYNYTSIATKHCTGFMNCDNMVSCAAYNFKYGFQSCDNVSNCQAYAKYICIANHSGNINYQQTVGFYKCHSVTNCSVNAINGLAVPEKSSSTADLRAYYYGFCECINVINCNDAIDKLTNNTDCCALQYASFVNCGNVCACTCTRKYIYFGRSLTTNMTSSTYINIFGNCDTVTQAYIASTSRSSKNVSFYINDTRSDKTAAYTPESTTLNVAIFNNCRNVAQCYVNCTFTYAETLGTNNLITFCRNCTQVADTQFNHKAGTITYGAVSTTGIQNCLFTADVDHTTCSASQTYSSDYPVADTPAGGFNKITV